MRNGQSSQTDFSVVAASDHGTFLYLTEKDEPDPDLRKQLNSESRWSNEGSMGDFDA